MTTSDKGFETMARTTVPDEHELAELARLGKRFSGHRIFRDGPHDRGVRYAAHAVGTAVRPHTVITDDLAELRSELEEASRQDLT
jgi:hypothetical protein